MGIRIQVVAGGTDIVKEATELEKAPHIVVSTPGRLAGHTCDGTKLLTKHLRYLVLDEADRLFESSFSEDLKVIFDSLPPKHKRQTLFFSATLTEGISSKASVLCSSEPRYVEADAQDEIGTVQSLKQGYIFIPQTLKETYLVYLLSQESNQVQQ